MHYGSRMFGARAIRWVYLLTVFLSSMLVGCGDPRTPEGAGYAIRAQFTPAKGSSPLPALDAKDVRIYSLKEELPVGVRFVDGIKVAEAYPSAAHPHRKVGGIQLEESVQYEVADAWDLPGFVAQREETVKRAAAEHGANAVFCVWTQLPGGGKRNADYSAVFLSDAAPEYPTVDEILSKLDLDGFHEVHRFTSKLSELPTRRPEGLQFKAGFEYRLAIALHPGDVEIRLPEKSELGFLVNVANDPLGAGQDREGLFTVPMDTSRIESVARPPVDGVFARGGLGVMGGIGRKVGVEFATRAATLRFSLHDPMKGVLDLPRLGAGEADFVVYERKVPADVLVERACFFCRATAEACSKREPLEKCAELQGCFKQIEQPLGACAAAYKGM